MGLLRNGVLVARIWVDSGELPCVDKEIADKLNVLEEILPLMEEASHLLKQFGCDYTPCMIDKVIARVKGRHI